MNRIDAIVENVFDVLNTAAYRGALPEGAAAWVEGKDVDGFEGRQARRDEIRAMIRSAIEANIPTWTVAFLPAERGYAAYMGALAGKKTPALEKKVIAKVLFDHGDSSSLKFRKMTPLIVETRALDELEAIGKLLPPPLRLEPSLLDHAPAWLAKALTNYNSHAEKQLYLVKLTSGQRFVGTTEDVLRRLGGMLNTDFANEFSDRIVEDALETEANLPGIIVDGLNYPSGDRKLWAVAPKLKEHYAKVAERFGAYNTTKIDLNTAIQLARQGVQVGPAAQRFSGMEQAVAEAQAEDLSRSRPTAEHYGSHALFATTGIVVRAWGTSAGGLSLVALRRGETFWSARGINVHPNDPDWLLSALRDRNADSDVIAVTFAGKSTEKGAETQQADAEYMRADGSTDRLFVASHLYNYGDRWLVTKFAGTQLISVRSAPTEDEARKLVEEMIPSATWVRSSTKLSPAQQEWLARHTRLPALASIAEAQAALASIEESGPTAANIAALEAALKPKRYASGAVTAERISNEAFDKGITKAQQQAVDDFARTALDKLKAAKFAHSDALLKANALEAARYIEHFEPVLKEMFIWTGPKETKGVAIVPWHEITDEDRATLATFGLSGGTHVAISSDGALALMKVLDEPTAREVNIAVERRSARGEWWITGKGSESFLMNVVSIMRTSGVVPEARTGKFEKIAKPDGDGEDFYVIGEIYHDRSVAPTLHVGSKRQALIQKFIGPKYTSLGLNKLTTHAVKAWRDHIEAGMTGIAPPMYTVGAPGRLVLSTVAYQAPEA